MAAHLGLDLVAVTLLTFGVFQPRHRRRELVPAYLALNVALFAVVAALGTVGKSGGLALGFGLFGVLSIVRLRSDAVQHQEVAYYFTTLVLGLLCGLPGLGLGVAAGLTAVLLLVVYEPITPGCTPVSGGQSSPSTRCTTMRRPCAPICGGGWGSRSDGPCGRWTTCGT